MTISRFYQHARELLHDKFGASLAENMIRRLLEDIATISPEKLRRSPDTSLPPDKVTELNNALQRILHGEPVQYITGVEYFFRLPFTVSKAVLIPRPETEELVEKALQLAEKKGRMLDVGTGSGCIAIAFKHHRPDWEVIAIDKSSEALNIAEANNRRHHAGVQFLKMDFLSEADNSLTGKFDLILSNPPYIPETEKEKLDKHVRDHEPHEALFVPEALLFYRKLVSCAQDHLSSSGTILVEVHQDFAEQVAGLFTDAGFFSEILKDISGNNRMVAATLSRSQ